MVIESPISSRLVSEFVGSALLLAVGLGAGASGADFGTVALAHGLAIGALLTASGHVSGGHFNPAITISTVVLRLKSPVEGALFVLAQLAGAFFGTVLIALGTGRPAADFAAAVPTLADGQSASAAFLLTVVASFLLVWVVYGVGLDRDGAWFRVAGLPIGLAVTAGILLLGPAGGGALATTRWFGPALYTTSWNHALVWITGPIVGGILAGAAYLFGIRPRIGGVVVGARTSVEP
ncbi:MAG: family channel protein [Thermoleophilia bacterium]|nr:family channel protein [Thermoleophilia bacterium]